MGSLRLGWLRFLLLVAGVAVLSPVRAVDRAVEDIRISRSGENAEAVIDLACAMRYVDHTPDGSGQELRIRLQVSPVCWRELGGIRSEVLRPEGGQMARIDEVIFDAASLAAVSLTVRFSRPVVFAVAQSLSGILILVDTEAYAEPNEPLAIETDQPARQPRRQTLRSVPALPSAIRHGDDDVPVADRFAIQLAAYPDDRTIPLPVLDTGNISRLYTRRLDIDGRGFLTLRAGFFDTEQEAQEVSAALASQFPEMVIVVAKPDEQRTAELTIVETAPDRIVAAGAGGQDANAISESGLQQMMDEARVALRDGDLERSVSLYSRALQLPGEGHRREAREYLGLARERKGQLAHAKAEYQAFLAEFPDGTDADRVRQRLAGMLAVAQNLVISHSRRRSVVAESAPGSRWDFRGGVSQYYRHDSFEPSTDGMESYSQSAVMSYADFWTRREGDRVDVEARLAAGYHYDMSSDDYSDGDQAHVSDAYLQIDDRKLGLGARIGRQTLYGKGILGRFDGANVSYRWRPSISVNVTGGMPADTPRHAPDGHRVFVGMSVDAENVTDGLDVSLFTHIQRFDGIADREAIGGEARYRDERWNFVASTDYDFSYGVLNWAFVTGAFRLSDRITLNGRADVHAYPFLTSGNALIGQPVSTLDDLNTVYTEGQIRTLARDRTAQARTGALGLSAMLTDRLQLKADVNYSHIDETEASGGVTAIPDSGDQFYFDISMIGSSLLLVGDTTILSLRRSTTSNATTNTLSLDVRYPLGEGLRVSPRIAVSQREYSTDATEQWVVSPMLRLLYRWHRRYRLELDVGARLTDRDLEPVYFQETVFQDNEQWTEYFVNLGYQMEF